MVFKNDFYKSYNKFRYTCKRNICGDIDLFIAVNHWKTMVHGTSIIIKTVAETAHYFVIGYGSGNILHRSNNGMGNLLHY